MHENRSDRVHIPHTRRMSGTSNEHGSDPNWATLGSRSGQLPRLTFQRVPEPKTAKVRIHLDVQVDDIDVGCREVEDLGGRFTGVRYDYDEGVVMNMLDPEGHEFCLVQYFNELTPPTR